VITFKRIEDRGAGLAAVFSSWGREIVLNEASLRIRIANLKAIDQDVSVEEMALARINALYRGGTTP